MVLFEFFAVQGFHFHDSVLNRKRSAEWMAADFNCNLLPDGQTLVRHEPAANLAGDFRRPFSLQDQTNAV